MKACLIFDGRTPLEIQLRNAMPERYEPGKRCTVDSNVYHRCTVYRIFTFSKGLNP